MKYIEILANFEREINELDNTFTKPATEDSLYWINQAVVKFVKLRFNGNLPHLTSYEQNEKRTKDLINLLSEKVYENVELSHTYPSYDEYEIEYPEDDLMFALNEDVVIASSKENEEGKYKMNTCVFECTADSFMYRVNNSLTDFHYKHHRARPLRIRTSTGVRLLTDGNYYIDKYTLGYLRQPNEITLENPLDEYLDFPEYILPEIIKIAAQMYIENKKDQRYQTISNEVNTQE